MAATSERGSARSEHSDPVRTLHLHVLGSGSKGNCAIVEGPRGLIMIDNGLSKRETLCRMHELGLDERRVSALVVTHEHSDHVKGLAVWHRAFKTPMFASAGTPHARRALEGLPFTEFEAGDVLELAGIRIETFSTSHDVLNPVGFRFTCRDDAIGFATDTGVLSDDARTLLADARILALESNHDVAMLRGGPYPRYLQDRIASSSGHLSNAQAAEALPELVGKRTEQVVAMHISQENNRPSVAVRTLAAAVGAALDNEIGSSATRPASNVPALHIRPASQSTPMSIA